MISNDIYQEPMSWAHPGFTLSQSRCPLLLLKGKCTETAIRRDSKLLLKEILTQWLTWLDCDSEFSSVNGWHDTSTCAPLILCFLSVTFLASAKRKISFVPLFTNSNKACLIRRSHCNLKMYFFLHQAGPYSQTCGRPGWLSFPHILKTARITSTHWPHQHFELLNFLAHPDNA